MSKDSPLKLTLFKEYHSTPIGGDEEISKTYSRLNANVTWEGMRKDITDLISKCHVCQQTKYISKAPSGLLQQIKQSSQDFWEDISMDFMVSLPAFQRNTVIMVFVDQFSKPGHFGMLHTHITACKEVELFTTMLCKLHEYPKLSYPIETLFFFLRKFSQTLFKLSETKLRISIAYHPQTDEQIEIHNRGIQQ